MKYIFKILLMFFSLGSFACDCELPNATLEFYKSELVFEGEIISKIVHQDSLNYTIIFKIDKTYKGSNKFNKISFTFNYQKKGHYDSCYWEACEDQKWLVYAHNWKEKLTFGYNCSNSKPLDRRIISKNEQNILDNGNSFKLENYFYNREKDFNYTKPISNIDSILKNGKIKEYEKPFTWLKVFVDKEGNLNSVTTSFGYKFKTDSIFNLPSEFEIKLRKPLTEFEKDAIALVKKVEKWEIKRHNKTNIPVHYIQHIAIEFDEIKKKWKYEL